jgi:hypothetical protein
MFVLPDYYLIFAFLSSILPQRLNAIRSLRIQQRGFYKHADIDYFRRRKVYSPVLSSRKVPLREPSSFRLAAEIVCKMPGLQELHMDMCFEGYFTPEPNSFRRSQESVVVDVFAPVLEMLQLKVLEGVEVMVTFDQLPVEGAHWIDLPFVQAEVEDM